MCRLKHIGGSNTGSTSSLKGCAARKNARVASLAAYCTWQLQTWPGMNVLQQVGTATLRGKNAHMPYIATDIGWVFAHESAAIIGQQDHPTGSRMWCRKTSAHMAPAVV
jgi:hypothetical protein